MSKKQFARLSAPALLALVLAGTGATDALAWDWTEAAYSEFCVEFNVRRECIKRLPRSLAAGEGLAISGAAMGFDVNVTNAGNITWTGSAMNQLAIWNVELRNSGTFAAAGDFTLFGNRLVNRGTFSKSGGSGNFRMDVLLDNDGGTLDAGSGNILYRNPGNVFQNGTRFSGAGQNILQQHGTFIDEVQSANLVLAATAYGKDSGNGKGAVAHGTIVWEQGSLEGTWAIADDGVLHARGAGGQSMNGARTTVQGRLIAEAPLALGGGAMLRIDGLMEFVGNHAVTHSFGGAPQISNYGAMRKTEGDGVARIAAPLFNRGTLDVRAGVMEFAHADIVFDDGTSFVGIAGGNRVAARAAFQGNFSSENLVLDSRDGVVTGADTPLLPGGGAIAAGRTIWASGALAGKWTLGPGSAQDVLPGTRLHVLDGTDWRNRGEVKLHDNVYAMNGASMRNEGLMAFQGDFELSHNYGAEAQFQNQGQLVKADGNGRARIDMPFVNEASATVAVDRGTLEVSRTFTNHGTVTASADTSFIALGGAANGGAVQLDDRASLHVGGDFGNQGQLTLGASAAGTVAGSLTNGGGIALGASATLNVLGQFENQPGASVGGTGQLILAKPGLGHGIVRPGFSPGMFGVTGSWAMFDDSALEIEVAGTDPGQFDVFDVSGNMVLDGTLRIVRLPGYVPRVGDSFAFLLFGSRAGDFDVIQTLGFSGVTFAVEDAAGALTLRVTAVPENATWVMLLGGVALMVRVVRRRTA
jgi:hypothetical protein